MPTYEFNCTDCGAVTEVRASFAEKDQGLEPQCDACGGANMRQGFSSVAVLAGLGGEVVNPVGGGCGSCAC